MDYQIAFRIAAAVAEADAVDHTLEIAPGIINLVYLKGRVGSAGLPRVQIHWGEHQLYPSTPNEWYHIDWAPIQFREQFLIYDYPFELTVVAYNLDQKFSHEVVVRVNIWPLEMLATTLTTPLTVPNPWPELD